MNRKLAQFVFVASAMLGISVANADTFAQRAIQIRAGNLLVSSMGKANATPHVWYHLDLDRSVKPANWVFVSPRAATTATSEIITRWTNLGATDVPTAGTRLTKKAAAYWEVDLSNASDAVLANYDILLLEVSGPLSLNSKDREKLRKFVDQGGTLWIDLEDGAPQVDIVNPTPVPFKIKNTGGPIFVDGDHQLLTRPNIVYNDEVQSLQAGTNQTFTAIEAGDLGGSLAQSQQWLTSDSTFTQYVAGPNATDTTLALQRIGDGNVVISARGLANFLNRGPLGSPGTFWAPPATFDAAYTVAAKLVGNMVSLNSTLGSQNGTAHKTGSTAMNTEAPLLRRFEVSGATPLAGTEPVHHKGRIIYVARGGPIYNGRNVPSGTLVVLDAAPSKDLDGNGDSDDGVKDPPHSAIDIMWTSASSTAAVTPTVASVFNGTTNIDVVFVTQTDGSVAAYELNPANPNNPAPVAVIAPADGFSNGPKHPVTVSESVGFVTDQDNLDNGRVWCFDVNSLQKIVSPNGGGVFKITRTGRLHAPSNAATVGYIPIVDNSGGVDKAVYVPTFRDTGPSRIPCGLTSLWFGSRGEAPVTVSFFNGVLTLYTRATLQNLPIYSGGGTLGIKISFVLPNGQPVPTADVQNMITGPIQVNASGNGVISFPASDLGLYDFTGTNNALPDVGIRIDYTLDWGAPNIGGLGAANSDQFIRGNLEFPDFSTPKREIVGNLALAPSGALFAVTSPVDAGEYGGSLFCLREEGRGEFKLMYRWELFDNVNYIVNGGVGNNSDFNYGPSVIDYDGLLEEKTFGGFLDQPFVKARFVGGPVVRGETAYVATRAAKGTGFLANLEHFGGLIAFNANPKPTELILNNMSSNFVVSQPDPARSDSVTRVTSFVTNGSYTYTTEDVGGVKIGHLTMNSMMTTTRGRIRDSIAVNLPIVLRQGGQSEIVVEPELSSGSGAGTGRFVPGNASGKWNPMKWYTTFNGFQMQSAPQLAGETMYLGGSSFLPSLFNGSGFANFTMSGLLYAMNVDITPSDLLSPILPRNWMNSYSKGPIEPRPWQKCLNQLVFTYAGANLTGVSVTPYFRWPQYKGVTSWDDLVVRINQASNDEPTMRGVVVGDNTLSAFGNRDFYAYTQGDFLIADEARISRVDASGNPIWSTEDSKAGGEDASGNAAGQKANLSKPRRVYPIGNSGYVVVDPGQSAIIRIDANGRESRRLTSLRLSPDFVPDGWSNNESKNLRMPSDVVTFTTVKNDNQNPFITAKNANHYEYWRHWLIADTANFRIIELVDRYEYDNTTGRLGQVVQYVDPQADSADPIRAFGMLLWHTPTELSGKQYAYNSIDRVFREDTNGNHLPVFAFGFGNVEATRSSFSLDNPNAGTNQDAQSGNGGIVMFDPAASSTELITKFNIGAIGADVLWNETAGVFQNAPVPAKTQKISGLTSVTLRYDEHEHLVVMFTDSSGVYEIANDSGTSWDTEWMLPNYVYPTIRRFTQNGNELISGTNPKALRAMYARRLDSEEVIIVNGYSGSTRAGSPFTGEVLSVDGRNLWWSNDSGFDWNKKNLGFNRKIIRFELPPLEGMRALRVPVFADRR